MVQKAMNSTRPARHTRRVHLARALLLLLLLAAAGCAARGQFRSNRAADGPVGAMSRLPAAVTFLDLDANPAGYRNRLIRVTGSFLPAPDISCTPFKGPQIDWAIVDNQLRLDVQGFAQVAELLPEGTPVTVDGFWQLYHGPLGCGKEPPRQTLWYLRAVQLVQPNPLPQLAGLPGEPVETEQEGEATEEPEETGTPTATPTPTPSATPDENGEDAQTATPDPATSPTPAGGETPTPSPTPEPGETPEPTPAATPTTQPGTTPPPPESSPTPGDYPDPTATTDPYP